MYKYYMAECIKLFKHPIVLIAYIILMPSILYYYIMIAYSFQQSFHTYKQFYHLNETEVFQHILQMSDSEPIKAYLLTFDLQHVIFSTYAVINVVGPSILLFVAMILFGLDYHYNTINHLYRSGIKVGHFLAGKLCAILTFICIFTLLAIVISVCSIFICRVMFRISVPLDLFHMKPLSEYLSTVGVTLSTLAIATLIVGIFVVLTKSTLGGLLGALAYFSLEVILGRFTILASYLPIHLQISMQSALLGKIELVNNTVSLQLQKQIPLVESAIISIVYILLFITILFLMMRRQAIAARK